MDYHNLKKEDFDILDISMSLSKLNRFVGHSKRAYSVAEHTLHGLHMAIKLGFTPLQQLHWLIHDFTEAYVGDCPSPLKALLPEYQAIEKKVAEAILDFVGIEPLTKEEEHLVHRIDRTMLMLEMRDLTHHNHHLYLDDDRIYHEILEEKDFRLDLHGYEMEQASMTLQLCFDKLLKLLDKG